MVFKVSRFGQDRLDSDSDGRPAAGKMRTKNKGEKRLFSAAGRLKAIRECLVEEVEVEGRVITAFLHPCFQSRLPGAKALRGHAGVQRSGGDDLHMHWAGFREKLGENLTFHIAWPNRF